jgi:hypothetical protein
MQTAVCSCTDVNWVIESETACSLDTVASCA